VEDGKLSPCNSYIITQTPMGLPKAKWLLLIGTTLLVVLGFAGLAIFKASRALRQATSELAAEEDLKFTVSPLNRAAPPGVEWISSPTAFNDAAFFGSRLYVCGPSGLVVYSMDGKPAARYRVGLELPAAPLAWIPTPFSCLTRFVGKASVDAAFPAALVSVAFT